LFSFIHIEHLYSAPSRKLLRGAHTLVIVDRFPIKTSEENKSAFKTTFSLEKHLDVTEIN